MSSKFKLDSAQVKSNIEALQNYMSHNQMEYFYISSFDPYLNEYVPMSDCHRFYFTNFTGSVAEVLVPASGKVKLYVDGRYHEQADLECDLNLVDVVKVGANQGLLSTLKEDLKKLSVKKIAVEMDRTSYDFFFFFENNKIDIHIVLSGALN